MKTLETIGKYKVLDTLGQGAMGVVYKALDPDINREVAIKTVRFDMLSDTAGKDEIMRRFIREAQAVGKLEHPNIITIYEVGREGDSTYIVMQLAKGQSLKEILDSGKSYKPSEIVELMERLCAALDYAHSQGVIHRDVKPANILIDETGRPYLVDFGVARLEMSTLTTAGSIMGTPSYMSPEQVMGKNVDSRADIFSLGVILFELLTNRRPFEGEHITTVVYKIAHEEPPTLSQVRNTGIQMFEPMVQKVLAKDPKDRYQTGKELSNDLKKASLPFNADETMIYDAAHEEEGAGRKTWLPFAAAGLVLVLAAAGMFVFKPQLMRNLFSSQSDLIAVPPPHIRSTDVLEAVLSEAEAHEFVPPKAKPRPPATSTNNRVNSELQQQITEGRARFQAGEYQKSRDLLNAVLQKDPNNQAARQTLNQANAALAAMRDIRALVERQRAAEESEDIALLSAFDEGSLAKKQTEIRDLFNDYNNLQCLIPPERIKIQLNDDRADVTFFKIVQGVSRAEGIRKEVFNGEVTWRLVKRDQNWVILDFTTRKFN
ncbi:MAG: serine/threonine-protein kinase [Candidatus Aminicenantaceae bacterium]